MMRDFIKSVVLYIAIFDVAMARYCENSLNAPINSDTVEPPSDKMSLTLEQSSDTPKRRCCPYDFDGQICKTVDDRVLCGFNKNIGKPKSKNKALKLSQGCRLRGGRLECGYNKGPYTNPRRPPVMYKYASDIEAEHHEPAKHYRVISDNSKNDNEVGTEVMGIFQTSEPHKSVTKCLEIKDRIVCHDLVK